MIEELLMLAHKTRGAITSASLVCAAISSFFAEGIQKARSPRMAKYAMLAMTGKKVEGEGFLKKDIFKEFIRGKISPLYWERCISSPSSLLSFYSTFIFLSFGGYRGSFPPIACRRLSAPRDDGRGKLPMMREEE